METQWDPEVYGRFAAERRQPFDDLLALVEPCPGGRVVDLGCGDGSLTVDLHRATGAAQTTGIDASAEMLATAGARAGGGLTFAQGDLADLDEGGLDLVFANASLQWVGDHPALVRRLAGALAPGGQLAFQVPANFDHPSHVLAGEVAAEEPFASALGTAIADHTAAVLKPVEYATVLDALGATDLHVRLQIYGHHLTSSAAVVDWVTGTLLRPYRTRLDDELWARYLDRYRERLVGALGPATPYFYPYPRILVRARLP